MTEGLSKTRASSFRIPFVVLERTCFKREDCQALSTPCQCQGKNGRLRIKKRRFQNILIAKSRSTFFLFHQRDAVCEKMGHIPR